jgi:putative ABC transport system permease protein
LQLILSTVQHVDIPTGNIPLSEAERLKRHPQIRQAIPISLGDTYRRFRIVGTEPAYLEKFRAEYAAGNVWQDSMQAVMGATVARETGLGIGDTFIGAHGLMPGGHDHADKPYTIVGVLQPTGAVLDRLIVTSLESVWDVHADHDDHAHEDNEHNHAEDDRHDEHKNHEHEGHDHAEHDHAEHDHGEHDHNHDSQNHAHDKHDQEAHGDTDASREVTALLVTYSNRAAALSFPRMINQQTQMQAASPAFEMARLVDLIGIGTDTAFLFAGFLLSVALASVLIGLLNSIRERRYDLAVFRTLGASRGKVMSLVLIEGMMIAIIGSIAGLLIGHGFVEAIGMFTDKGIEIGLKGFIFLPEVWGMIAIVLVLSFLICLVPAWEAYRTNIRSILTRA